ncbi:hypothetical protein AB0D29_31735 [Streptomyces sp. NPDC048424]|uniref:hypothetical protein n=1 Tax=Streptomyces sp. NPDC048424 TaxID=3155265 RepID=UPI00344007BE
MPRRTKWMIAGAVLFVVAVELPVLVWFCGLLYALKHAGETEEVPAGCGKAMTAIGWKLPPHADREDCFELDDPAFGSQWTGTFRMPRSEVRGWLDSHPEERSPTSRASRGAVEGQSGYHLNLHYPKAPNFGDGGIDFVEVDVAWEGEEAAVVTFRTYPD